MIKKIKEIASEVLETEITDDSSQANCENWDSLRHLNLIIALEEAFDVSFEPEDIAEMKSIAAIEAFLKK